MGRESWSLDLLACRILFGAGHISSVADELEQLGARRVLGIADPFLTTVMDRLGNSLGDLLVARIDEVRQHVPLETAEAARSVATRGAVDAVVVVGGGSAIGLAKAIAVEGGQPIVAIPTTYAGSEMTDIWGITEGGTKRTARDPRVRPAVVIYDPLLTLSMPPTLTGPSGFNALAHSVEAVWAPGTDPITTAMALESIRFLTDGLPRAYADPGDVDARGACQIGASIAGLALAQAGTWVHHKLCHFLGGTYDLPHAETHAVVLPYSAALVGELLPDPVARVAEALGVEDAATGLRHLGDRVGVPASLHEVGLTQSMLDEAEGHGLHALAATLGVEPSRLHEVLRDAREGRPLTVPA